MTETPNTQTEVTLNDETLSSDPSRRAFLGKLLAGAAAATALTAAPVSVFASTGKLAHVGAGVPASDGAILNFALTLEHLEARFYERAAHSMVGRMGYLGRLVSILRFDEESHVNALTAAIKSVGYTPVAAAPRYNFPTVFGNRKAFLKFAAQLEDTGVHAYLGQAPAIKTPSILLTAASIVTVEARHAGAIHSMLQQNPTQGPFDKGLTTQQILDIVTPLIGK